MTPLPLPVKLFTKFGFGPAEWGISHVCSAHCSNLIPHFSSALPKELKGFQTNKCSHPAQSDCTNLHQTLLMLKRVKLWYNECHLSSVENIGAEVSTFNCLGIIYRLQTAAVVVGHQWCTKQFVMMHQCCPFCLFFLIPNLIPLGWVDKTWGLTHLLDSKHAGPPTFVHHYILQLWRFFSQHVNLERVPK